MRVVRTRDVIFDKTLVYDFAKLDSKHLLTTSVKETLEIIEISDNIFFEVIIDEDEDDLPIDHLEDGPAELRFVESAYQAEKALFLHTDMKDIYLLTPEMISDRDQGSNANTIDTVPLLQTGLEIDEVLDPVQGQSILSSSIEDGPQPQPSTKPKKGKQPVVVPADAVTMNTRSRKQTYSAALVTVEALGPFHAAFSVGLERPDQKKPQIPKLHRDDLPVEPRY
jgi:hypothetical protein